MNKYNTCPISHRVAMIRCYRHLTAEDQATIIIMRSTHSIRHLSATGRRFPWLRINVAYQQDHRPVRFINALRLHNST